MNRNILLIVLLLTVLACGIPSAPANPSPVPPSLTPTVRLAPSATATQTPPALSPLPSIIPTFSTPHAPGLIIRGHVTYNGAGLAGVSIYRNYAAYEGVVVAVTDADGYYQSDFMGIPGDEMVGVWAQLQGYIFDPPNYNWRHYYGFEVTTLDFRHYSHHSCQIV